VLRRHRFSALYNGNLDAVLAGLKVDSLILTGLSTINDAISTAVRDTFARDLPVMAVGDCCTARVVRARR
jgi:ureidoacrylate peracid hydrolase